MYATTPSITALSAEYGAENCEDGSTGPNCEPAYVTDKDGENFRTVIDLLLLLGKLPDDKDVITTDLRANVNMDGLMFEVDELMNNELSSFSTEDLRHLLEALIQIQADNGDMKVEKTSKIYGIEQPTLLLERSNASSIVNTVDNSVAHLAEESTDDISEDEQSFTDAEL